MSRTTPVLNGSMLEKSVSSAPAKLMLFGEHGVMYGIPSLATSVDQRIYAETSRRDDDLIVLYAEDVGFPRYECKIDELNGEHPKEVKFALSAVKHFQQKYDIRNGLEIRTKSKFPKKAVSFGGSSASVGAIVHSLMNLYGKEMSLRDLFDIGYEAHTMDVQKGDGSGYDIACAVYGGIIRFKRGGAVIEPVEIGSLPLLYAATGQKFDTSTKVREVKERVSENPQRYQEVVWGPMARVVDDAFIALKKGNYKEVGELMTMNNGLLTTLGVNTSEANRFVEAAINAGAIGGKMTGGGGDNVIILVPEDKEVQPKVSEVLEKEGASIVMKIKTNAEGVRQEKSI